MHQRALDLAADLPATPSNIERVEREVGQDAARWAFTQWELRRKATAKFERAGEMLFTREALEQASHEEVAQFHASLFPEGELVADLTCGIGADLIALAGRGPAVGYELDPERAEAARHNLAVYGLEAEVRVEDSLSAEWPLLVFADPSRRVEGRRTLSLEEFSPDPRPIAERCAQARLGVMKLSPMLADRELGALGRGVAFVSHDGDCKEALVLCGLEARAGVWAVQVGVGGDALWLAGGAEPGLAASPGPFVYAADPAAIRADALGTLCKLHGLNPLGDSNGYLTGGECESPWLVAFEALDHGPFSLKRVQQQLRTLRGKIVAVKTRAHGSDPAAIQKALKNGGEQPLTLLLYREGKSIRYVLGRRLLPLI